MAKTEVKNTLGIFISPKEICIAQIKTGKDARPIPEHLVKFPTGFTVKEGMLRPLSLNNEFFGEKASWLAPFAQALKQVSWGASSVVVSLSPQFAILRYFVMPRVDRKFWNKSIPLESKKYIPVSFDEVVYDFDVSPVDDGKKLGVLFGLTQRKSVEFIINTLKVNGLDLAAVEIGPASLERLFGFIDAKDHESKGYIHFAGGSTYMMFSNSGFPVLYRETEGDASGSMSERKRLDIKGAVQFVDRYVGGGAKYQNICLSGDGTDIWKPLAEKEAETIPVSIWDPFEVCSIKDGSVAALFAFGAALRNRMALNPRLDISGISSAAKIEKEIQRYVWGVTAAIGGMLLLFSVINQVRLSSLNSRLASLQSQVSNVPELLGSNADEMRRKIDNIRSNGMMLQNAFFSSDLIAPKLAAVADNLPPDLWVSEVSYVNPLQLTDRPVDKREFILRGMTFLSKERKTNVAEMFLKALRSTTEFKSFTPPNGNLELIIGADGPKDALRPQEAKPGQFDIFGHGRGK
ncbi:MAG: hypothetical protein A2234_00060 [Elusimicrobia bacterium RIFOXYA2_FULL_58_8]|nr:MAG: hypothetical protein A2285_05985 [Elusimicrobia bacterium RIFOXYA12_FULL_57_11]OGS15246.1 MAG: hypothetical protein A2234_00060 [Elusimicrobia bacterium RIFOXYA2_FULL_58_8]